MREWDDLGRVGQGRGGDERGVDTRGGFGGVATHSGVRGGGWGEREEVAGGEERGEGRRGQVGVNRGERRENEGREGQRR